MKFSPSKYDRPVFGKICSEYNLTYYGTAIPSDDSDYTPVRGLTASPEQVDDNYSRGIISGYPVQLLQRTHDVLLSNMPERNQTWTICEINMHRQDLPHFYLNGLSDDDQYSSVLISFLRMYEIDLASLGQPILNKFRDHFCLYITPDDIPAVQQLFTLEIQNMLASYFANIDIEIDGDKLYIYSVEKPIKLPTIDKMLRIGLWLASRIDYMAK